MAISARHFPGPAASLAVFTLVLSTHLSVADADLIALPATLDQLLPGVDPAPFAVVEDKRFSNFSFDPASVNTTGQPISPMDIQVSPLTSGNPFADPGLRFSASQTAPSNFILDPSPGMGMFSLQYDVTVTDPTMLIKDNLVEIGAPFNPQPGPNNLAEIVEEVFDPENPGSPIATKRAFSDNDDFQIIDTADFVPSPVIHVETFGQVENNGAEPFASIETFSQTFSQLQVPEPTGWLTWILLASIALFSLARRPFGRGDA